ncbi:hypothetical protein [Candidatus Mycoplasma haematohominis]|uniref:Uncharacterized protein n=1 Tax=Candidatus Mycoplasma haematohominis TaxID=1494318 RepID=A0A478FSX8_9MOLU|nr:hypothetical protein [Candidatus Mycoplasma haemohominis]GCE63185.1 hypothetical protein MHSWG343_01630 [Candidatus Mycoplasma haemohominis]
MSTNNNLKKLADKVYKQIKETGYIEKASIEKIIDLSKEDSKTLIKHLIDLESDPNIRKRLCNIYDGYCPAYDSKLELLAVWSSFNISIKKSFNPEDII